MLGPLWGVWENQGSQGCIEGFRGVLGAGRECRYSGARRGIGGIRGYWGARGVGAIMGEGLLVMGPSALGMASFLNRLYWFGVVGLCTLGVD